MLSDQVTLPVAGVCILLAVYIARSKFTYSKDVSRQLPWVGRDDGFMSGFRARLDSLRSNALEISDTGYKKFSRSGSSFVLPGFDTHSVIIPGSDIKWLIDQPDNVLSAAAMQRDTIQTDYSLLDPDIARHTFQEITIRRDLTRAIGGLIPEIEEELNVGIDKYWGLDTENWNDVCIFDTVQKIVTRTSNRAFVGLPLCRNDDFIDNSCKYVQSVAISGSIIKLIPELLKPLTAWIFQLPTRWHLHRANKHLLPELVNRMERIEQAGEAGKEILPWNDFAFWYMIEALNNPSPKERSAEMIAKRVMATNFAAIHTSTFTATNILIDLYSSPRAEEFIAELREEVSSVLAANEGKWDKSAISKLVRVDSAVRESMRISIFQSHGLYRLVVDPKGVTMNDGLHLPQGTKVGTSTYSIHHDETIYNDANTYDAFRFSREREGNLSVLKAKNLSTVTTSDTFLAELVIVLLDMGDTLVLDVFSVSGHAFNASFKFKSRPNILSPKFHEAPKTYADLYIAITEMKLLLAYIVLNYDVKPLKERPQGTFTAGFRLPPQKSTLSVKRRIL